MAQPLSLSKLKLVQLRALSMKLGLPVSGSKAPLIAGILSVPLPPPPAPIISIDMGIKNLAFCTLSPSLEIISWKRKDFPVPTDIREFADLAKMVISDLFKEFPKTRLVLIEKQRWRSGGAPQIQQWTVCVNTLEHMLYVLLYQRRGVAVESVDPARVARYVDAKGKLEKRDAVKKFVDELKGDKEMWGARGKKDDLADCLLQAWVWMKWMENRRQWVKAGKIPDGILEEVPEPSKAKKPTPKPRKARTVKDKIK